MKKRLCALAIVAAMTLQMISVPALAAQENQTSTTDGSSVLASSSLPDASAPTPIGTTFTSDSINYLVTSLTEVEVTGLSYETLPAELVIPEKASCDGDTYTVTAIADGAFTGCDSVTLLSLPTSLKSIGTGLHFSSLKKITVADGNENFFVKDNVLFAKTDAGNELVLYPSGSDSAVYVIPDDTTVIRTNAFYAPSLLATVIFPSDVKTINTEAFTEFPNPLTAAFKAETDTMSIASRAFVLDVSANNKFYFKNKTVLDALQSAASDFVVSSGVAFSTDGFPESVLEAESTVTKAQLSSAAIPSSTPTPAEITNGTYMIKSSTGNYALDIAAGDGSQSDSANADIWTADQRISEVFNITKNADNTYTIELDASGLVLDVAGAQDKDGSNVQQYTSNSSKAQKYTFYDSTTESGAYTIHPGCSSTRVLDVSYGKGANGNNVQIWSANGTAAQNWTLVPVTPETKNPITDGIYTISNKNGKVLDVSSGSPTNGSNVQIWTGNGTNAQKYYVKSLGYGSYYYVINAFSLRSLDACYGGTKSGTNVWIYDKNNTSAQIWRITKDASDGCCVIRNQKSGLSLDVDGGRSSDGANVQLWTDNGTTAQRWTFTSCNETILTNGMYNIESTLNSSKIFDIEDASLSNFAKLQVFMNNGNVCQKWEMTDAGKDSSGANVYNIVNVNSGKVLDIPGADFSSGVRIQQYSLNNSDAQKWKIVSTGNNDGSYYIEACNHPGLRLDLKGGQASDHAALILNTADDSSASQSFYMQGTIIGNGWHIVNGKYKYYLNGIALTNAWIGSAYVGSDGLAYSGWHQAPSDSGNFIKGYWYYFADTNGAQTDARPYMFNLFGTKTISTHYNIDTALGTRNETAANAASNGNSSYMIYVNRNKNIVYICAHYPNSGSSPDYWNLPVFAMKTSTGNPATPTHTGTTIVNTRNYWQQLMGPSYGQYATLINTAGDYFHSVACGYLNDHNVDASSYNMLGQHASHGCCRLCVRNAYWIYAFCEDGTPIYVSDNLRVPTTSIYQPYMQYGWVVDPKDVRYTNDYGYCDNGLYYYNGSVHSSM